MEHNVENNGVLEQLRLVDDKLELLQEAIDQLFELTEDVNEKVNQLITYLDGGEDEVADE